MKEPLFNQKFPKNILWNVIGLFLYGVLWGVVLVIAVRGMFW